MYEVSRYVRYSVCILLLFVALQVQPTSTTVSGGAGSSFDEIVTLINDGPIPVELRIQPTMHSQYLVDDVSLSENAIYLLPQETKNLQVRGSIPYVGPGNHSLTYEILSDDTAKGSFTLDMPIEGEVRMQPEISISSTDITRGEAVVVHVNMTNAGNNVLYYLLALDVREQSKTIGNLSYPQAIQVLPGEQEQLSLVYSDFLEPGVFDIVVRAEINQQETISDTTRIQVSLADENQTIMQGEDVEVSIKRYNSNPLVTYRIRDAQGVELRAQTTRLNTSILTVPTASLGVGEYRVEIIVEHESGVDQQEFLLQVTAHSSSRAIFWQFLIVVVFGGVLYVFRRHIRVWYLLYRIHRQEKRLNTLVRKAHQLTHGS